jgi:SprT protein
MQISTMRATKIPEEHLPPGAFPIVSAIFDTHLVEIKVVKSRTTKFADFIPPQKNNFLPKITINNNLNPYSFLITLLHEFAHYLVWREGRFYAKPHGRTWKNHFRLLMQQFIDRGIFPVDLLPPIIDHFQNPKATSCSDIRLFRLLADYDSNREGVFIQDMPDGAFFQTPDGKLFKRENKVRKRILCVNQTNRRKYLFSPIYKVFPVKGQQYVIAFP